MICKEHPCSGWVALPAYPTPPHPTPSLLHINIHPHLPQNPFAGTRFTMPRSTFAAQAQYLVHSGLPLLSHPRGSFCMHRRIASCTWGVFVNCAFPVRWAIVDAQAQYFVYSGLPLTSNPSPTAGHFVCTGVQNDVQEHRFEDFLALAP